MSENYNPFSLRDKTVLVTGASSGIGRATAIVCSKMGANVIVTGRNEVRLNETFNHLEGHNHTAIIADLATKEGRDSLFNAINKIDGVVHCAGISGHKVFQFLKEDEIQKMFEINFNTPLLLSRDFITILR